MTILCYHTVDRGWNSPLAVTPEVFDRHCRWLGRRDVLDLDAGLTRLDHAGRLPRGQMALTFDDGLSGVYLHAFPVLRRYGLPATVFLVAETLTAAGRRVDWVDDPPRSTLTTLTRDEVMEMADSGIAFGSHSYAHHDLTTLGEDECERDLRASREVLEDVLSRPVRLLAYPRGRHDERVRRAAGRAGFTHGFGLPEGPEDAGVYAVPRVGVYARNGVVTLLAKSHPRYLAVRTSRVYQVVIGGRRHGQAAAPMAG